MIFPPIIPNVAPLLTFLKENWKQLLFAIFFLWAVVCTLTHCRGLSPWDVWEGTTTTIQIDTFYVYADTSKIIELHEKFNTQPKNVKPLQSRTRFQPAPIDFNSNNSCRDSLNTLWAVSKELSEMALLCDSMYGDATAIRSYSDSLRNDSIVLYAAFDVSGKLVGEPKFGYRYLLPKEVIREVVTINHAAKVYRKLYAEAAVGPRLLWKGNELATVVGTLGVGFTDKKDWSYGIAADFSHVDYAVKFAVRKSVSIGSR
jgi:hypothetical protein